MARPIAPTPRLDARSSDRFLESVTKNLGKKSRPISTPNIDATIKSIMAHAIKKKKRAS
ncbi:hypothetical protein SAMN02746065_10914 [Desulfocicer vacuolatum DSM 3385]|uniref:Uncharacterized protein n=1 Tax=Desulfocicer vacuolatum DSM 3385 TaxID=1121400 RepID=A0A1W2BNZ8_9BACT|nr:hypothetical protein [Desulfocicer vacuolatum]SMC74576.1 hypothetical protein SAMN02746065_10914 [Desulfocicer vacuolatum DSM 3385]